MAVLLFRLNGVSDDEAQEVRELLAANHFDIYETDAGRFGISVAALWLKDESQATRAKQLLQEYQHERTKRMRQQRQQAIDDGTAPSFTGRLKQAPGYVVAIILCIGIILYFSLAPFLSVIDGSTGH